MTVIGGENAMYENIARLCAKRNINVATMCKEIGLQPTTISALKHGRAKALSIGNAARIADYFGVTVDVLLNGEAPESSEKIPRYREFREKAGMTLDDVLRAVGISQKRLEDIELGVEEAVDDDVQKLADLYGCSAEQLREVRAAEPAMYVQDRYFTKRAENIDALAREILRISHEQGLSLNDIKTACDKCERFVMQSPVPEDSRGWISRKYFF